MKKILLLFFSFTLFGASYGQSLNFQGGMTFSQLDWELSSFDTGSLFPDTYTGYNLFVGADYLHRKYMNLSSNAGLIRKGGKGELVLTDPSGQPTGETVTETLTLDYVSLNTLLDLHYPVGDHFLPFLSMGPRCDFLISYSQQFDGLADLDELNSIAWGFLLGGGIKYSWDQFLVGLRADYYLDLGKVADWEIHTTGTTGEVSTQVFAVNLIFGYRL